MDSKAAFEGWWQEHLAGDSFSDEIMGMVTKDVAFDAWKASRAEIEIELPKASDYFIDEDEATLFDALIVDVELKVTSHGIRIKGKTEC